MLAWIQRLFAPTVNVRYETRRMTAAEIKTLEEAVVEMDAAFSAMGRAFDKIGRP